MPVTVTWSTTERRSLRCQIERDGKFLGDLYGRTQEHLRSNVVRVLHLNGIKLHEVEEVRRCR